MSTATLVAASPAITVRHGRLEWNRMRYADPEAVPAALPQPAPAALRRIVLTGFMGAGKSTVGRRLAAELGWEFLDLDALIEQRTGLTTPQIFAAQGEDAFRRIESLALAVALGRHSIVLALGGGTPEMLTNQLLLEQTPHTLTIYLHAPLSVLTGRCHSDAVERPLLARQDDLVRRFSSRQPLYRRLANVTVDTTTFDAEQTALILRDHLKPRT